MIRLRLGEGSNKIQVHEDILCYSPEYFKGALSSLFPVPAVFSLNPDNEFPLVSLMRIFDHFIYTGNYKDEWNEDRFIEERIADYFHIDQLVRILQ